MSLKRFSKFKLQLQTILHSFTVASPHKPLHTLHYTTQPNIFGNLYLMIEFGCQQSFGLGVYILWGFKTDLKKYLNLN